MYYLIDKKYDETLTINFIGSEKFDTAGKNLSLLMPECVKGISKITSYTDNVSGETSTSYLKKFFKFKNGVNTEWSESLPIESITGITICPKKCLQLELLYFVMNDGGGAFPSSGITLSNISIGGEYDITKSDSQLILKKSDPYQILEVGDVLKIFSIDNFDVVSTAKYLNAFTIKYRYSQNDKLTWTQWELLTKENISTVKWDKIRFVDLQYLFELNPDYTNDVKIYEVLLYGDFQNVTTNSKKLNKFGLRENCINIAFKTAQIGEQTSGINDELYSSRTTSAKTPNSNTISLIKEASEYQLRMNWMTQGMSCYSNPPSVDGTTQIQQLTAENTANKANFWNPYEFGKITEWHNMLATQISQMLGVNVEYHLTDPDGKGIDRIMHEHQLYNVIDYKMLKVLVPDNQFPESTVIINQFNLDLFDTFKVHVLKEDFKNAFGVSKRPGQEDILYFCQVDRLYIIKHAQIHKNIMNAGIYYDVVLEKYEKRAHIDNKVQESKTRIEELTRNTTIDDLFGVEEEDEYKKIANKVQMKPKSFDVIRSNINPRTNFTKEAIYNGDMKVIESYYDFANVAQTENAVEYIKVDNVLLKSDNRSFIFWFKFPNEYKEGNAITKRVIAGYELDSTKYFFMNNSSSGLGYSIFYQTEHIYFSLNEQVYKMPIDVMTNVWFSLIINLDQRQRVIDMKLFRRNTQLEVLLFQPKTYDKLQLSIDETVEIEYEMRVNGFRAVDNIETTIPKAKPVYNLMNSIKIENIEPAEFEHTSNLTIPGSKIFMTNIRILNDLIGQEYEQHILNELIVKESQHLILGDNANKKLITTNYANKQWR